MQRDRFPSGAVSVVCHDAKQQGAGRWILPMFFYERQEEVSFFVYICKIEWGNHGGCMLLCINKITLYGL